MTEEARDSHPAHGKAEVRPESSDAGESPPLSAAPAAKPASAENHGGGHWLRRIIVLCILGGLGVGGYYWYINGGLTAIMNILPLGLSATTKTATTAQAGRSMPVVVAKSTHGDLPIYLNGLGTVTALNTVTVRSRVDGQLDTVLYTEGLLVKEGQLLAEIDPRPFQVMLDQAKGQLLKDQASLLGAQKDLARYEEAGQAASQQQRDQAAAAVGQYNGAVQSDLAQIANANLQLIYCKVTSPLTGTIGLRLVDAGNVVHQTDPNGLAVITQMEPIAVIFPLAEDTIHRVQKAMNAGQPVLAEAWDRDLRKLLTKGELIAIDSAINPATATVRLKAKFDNKDHALYPNQFVNVRLLVDVKKDVVLVPAAAVQRSPQTMFVYVVKSDKTVEMRPVKVGPTEGEMTAILSGLSPDEIVVTDGVDKLQPGMRVSMRAPEGATTQSQPASGPAPASQRGGSADVLTPKVNSAPAGAGQTPSSGRHGTESATQGKK